MREIFNSLSEIKKVRFLEEELRTDVLIGTSPYSIFKLEYNYSGWTASVKGELMKADLGLPSGLPFGARVNNNLWTVNARHNLYSGLPEFRASPVRKILRKATGYRINSPNDGLVKSLSNLDNLSNYYDLEYGRSNVITGYVDNASYVVSMNFDTIGNDEEIVLTAVGVLEEFIDVINQWQDSVSTIS